MLEHTFIHIPGIGPKTEQAIWRRGILTWEQFLNQQATVLSPGRDDVIHRELTASLENREDIRFFLNRLPVSDHWRTYWNFKDQAVFLDIETNGGYQGLEEITLIGLFDGSLVRTFISGRDLHEFEEAIQAYDLVITYNGTGFDLPCLKRCFRHLTLPAGHIDLRFLLKKIGLAGGLKAIEKKVGLVRDAEVDGLNGFDAVHLWKAYEWGDESALRRLILYNTADIVHLKPLMELAFREMKTRLLTSPT
jgi:uncharacterized protein